MLNDLSAFTRLSTFFQVAPFGMLIGLGSGISASGATDPTGYVVVFACALGTIIVWALVTVTWLRRMSRRSHRDIERGSEEILSGRADASLVPARVLRVRRAKRNRPWGLGREVASTPPAWSTAFTVLPTNGPPRRVGALVPMRLSPKSSALLALHPTMPEVGVLHLGVTNDEVTRAAQDPRWSSERLPTDRVVVGGYLPLIASAIAGVLSGAALAVLILLIAG